MSSQKYQLCCVVCGLECWVRLFISLNYVGTLINWTISLLESYGCPSTSEATLKNMGKSITYIIMSGEWNDSQTSHIDKISNWITFLIQRIPSPNHVTINRFWSLGWLRQMPSPVNTIIELQIHWNFSWLEPLYKHRLPLIEAWISNYIYHKMYDEITYLVPKLKFCIFEDSTSGNAKFNCDDTGTKANTNKLILSKFAI